MAILPIGSVIKVKEVKLMVTGHFSKEKETKNQYYYVCVPYPIGFVDQERVIALSIDEPIEVLHEGYQTERSEKYIKGITAISELTPLQTAVYSRIAVEAMKEIK